MKIKHVAILLFTLISNLVFAEWTVIRIFDGNEKTKPFKIYLDPAQISRIDNNSLLTIPYLADYEGYGSSPEEATRLSEKGIFLFDCKNNLSSRLGYSTYSGKMGSGQLINTKNTQLYASNNSQQLAEYARASGRAPSINAFQVACEKNPNNVQLDLQKGGLPGSNQNVANTQLVQTVPMQINPKGVGSVAVDPNSQSEVVQYIKNNLNVAIDTDFSNFFKDCNNLAADTESFNRAYSTYASEDARQKTCASYLKQGFPSTQSHVNSANINTCSSVYSDVVLKLLNSSKAKVNKCNREIVSAKNDIEREKQRVASEERRKDEQKARDEWYAQETKNEAKRMENPSYRAKKECTSRCQAEVENCVINNRAFANQVCGLPNAACLNKCDSIR